MSAICACETSSGFFVEPSPVGCCSGRVAEVRRARANPSADGYAAVPARRSLTRTTFASLGPFWEIEDPFEMPIVAGVAGPFQAQAVQQARDYQESGVREEYRRPRSDVPSSAYRKRSWSAVRSAARPGRR